MKALTDLWTGSVRFEEDNDQILEKIVPDRLITTGLLGSIRWWFEVLVRGIGGTACDPSDRETRCPDKNGQHCVVCEFFGCTGWARKFRLEVRDQNGRNKTTQIIKDESFCLHFTPLRPVRSEEWALLDTTLRLIAEYGAVGGKTVLKPTNEKNRQNAIHHRDYGLVDISRAPQVNRMGLGDLHTYVSSPKWRQVDQGDFTWASLQYFWCVHGEYLARQDANRSKFNKVIGREESKKQAKQPSNVQDKAFEWLAGREQESKKIFSFKKLPRTFGFVKPGLISFSEMKQKLEGVWGQSGWKLLTGEEIISQILAGAGKEDC